MIKVLDLCFKYKQNGPLILNNLSFCIPNKSILTILGQNGVGKTTFIKCLTSEICEYDGSITIDKQEVRTLSSLELSKKIAVVASNSQCYQNLCVAEYLVTGFTNQMLSLQTPRKEQYEQAEVVLSSFGKSDLYDKNIFEISTGEMQIVRIARAVLQNPQIIIFDEPTAALDVRNQLIVLDQISALNEQGYTIITTTHNPGHAIELNGLTLALYSGTYAFGETQTIITEENLNKIYGLPAELKVCKYRNYTVFSNNLKKHKLIF